MLMSTAARLNMRSTEKKVLKYYDDGGKIGRGNCTWGVGILAHRGPCTKAELARSVTDVDIEREFASRLATAERSVRRNVKAELTQAQFDALVSLTYNAGVKGSFPVYALLNSGEYERAASYIASMTTAKQKLKGKWVQVSMPGLVARRQEESAPFRKLSPPDRSASK